MAHSHGGERKEEHKQTEREQKEEAEKGRQENEEEDRRESIYVQKNTCGCFTSKWPWPVRHTSLRQALGSFKNQGIWEGCYKFCSKHEIPIETLRPDTDWTGTNMSNHCQEQDLYIDANDNRRGGGLSVGLDKGQGARSASACNVMRLLGMRHKGIFCYKMRPSGVTRRATVPLMGHNFVCSLDLCALPSLNAFVTFLGWISHKLRERAAGAKRQCKGNSKLCPPMGEPTQTCWLEPLSKPNADMTLARVRGCFSYFA